MELAASIAAVVISLAALAYTWWVRRADTRDTQSGRVAAWIADWALAKPTAVIVRNGSDLPVYQSIAWLVLATGAGPQTGEDLMAEFKRAVANEDLDLWMEMHRPAMIAVIAPGEQAAELPPWPGGGMSTSPGVEIAFSDAAGRHWIRRVDGRLEGIPKEPWQHYGFGTPTGL